MRLNRVGVLAVVHLCEKKEQLFNSFYAQTLSGSSPAQNKKEPLLRLFFLVRETGLEPVRDYHTPLKRARLPIPPLSH